MASETGIRRGPESVPIAPGRLPILGHSVAVLRDPLGFVASLPQYGDIVQVDLGPRQAYVLTTPDLIREVGFGQAGHFHRDELAEAISMIVHGSVNVLSGSEHALRRRMIAPAFKQSRMSVYTPLAVDIANRWSNNFVPDVPINMVDSAHALVLDTISSTLFRADFGDDAKKVIRDHVPWLLSEVIIRGAMPPALTRMRVIANRRFASHAKTLRASIGAVVTRYRESGEEYSDVLSALLGHTDVDTGTTLTDDEIVDELILVLAAGVGSEASILSWLIHEVSTRPDVAQRVFDELDEVLGDGPLLPEHVRALPYLHQVLQETLRYWGPWISLLTAGGTVHLGDVDLPDGSAILFSPYMIHHDDTWYTNPAAFDPDRWSPHRIASIDKRAVLPFGVGERRCPGNLYAVMAVTAAAAALFRRWRLEPDSRYRVRAQSRDFVPSPTKLPVTPRLRKV
ncbi:MAG: cytochrome P450 [Rhodococcus sp.]|nr:cytochrome P450 [Rhodococcus sp. (in: high G+C Gram-positive bacteria)]